MSRLRHILGVCFVAFLPSLSQADEDQFVADSLLAVLYHELAHALIHQMELPIFGQEEDAADVLSSYLIAKWHGSDESRRIANTVGINFFADFVFNDEKGKNISWDGEHGPAKQRMYNHLCVYAGSDLGLNANIALGFDMSMHRLVDCDVEYSMARYAWGDVLLDLIDEDDGGKLVAQGDLDTFTGRWAVDALDRINSVITFPEDIPVIMKECGQFNAFYDSRDKVIEMCLEQEPGFRRQFDAFYGRFPLPDPGNSAKMKIFQKS